MDPIATLLLARTHTVVLDADRVASAATRPARDADLDRFEDELLQLGFVMSLDLAMTVRRLPHETLRELKTWMIDTLGKTLALRPNVPLHPLPASTSDDPYGAYVRRALTWLATRAEQPCPWCGRTSAIGALDPCGHLVCRTCWTSGNYSGCSICHRRVRSLVEPFAKPAAGGGRVEQHDGALRIVHLALDLEAVVKARFERMLLRTTPMRVEDRDELEKVIDAAGPKAALWLPKRIPVRETMAIAVARLWIVAPDRLSMMKATQHHLATATDVLRVAAVLMRANASLREPMRLASIPRGMRRALLEAIERLPLDLAIEEMRRYRGLWKRVGERLHPREWPKLANAGAAFAAIRSNAPRATWGGAISAALATGDARAAAAKLVERPDELVRRFDHVARVALAKQRDAIADVLATLRDAAKRGAPELLLQLAAHVARRRSAWPRRVFFAHGDPLAAWRIPDARAPLPDDVIESIVAIVRGELVARAAARRNYARAVIDRRLGDLLVPHTAAKYARGSELAIESAPHDVALDHFDADWRHVPSAERARYAVATRGAEIPFMFDVAARRARWLDIRAHTPPTLGMLAHLGRDFADLAAPHARPTLWDVAAIHAAARANTIYVRDDHTSIATYKRRDGVILPKGSEGYALEHTSPDPITRLTALDLVAELGGEP